VATAVPSGTPLRAVSFARGVATIDRGEKFASGTSSSSLSARITQLVLTATSVPGVKSVRLQVKGATPLGLFPGMLARLQKRWLSADLSKLPVLR
jgi:spore germination protein GerM